MIVTLSLLQLTHTAVQAAIITPSMAIAECSMYATPKSTKRRLATENAAGCRGHVNGCLNVWTTETTGRKH
jgi:hypothetical protein